MYNRNHNNIFHYAYTDKAVFIIGFALVPKRKLLTIKNRLGTLKTKAVLAYIGRILAAIPFKKHGLLDYI